MNHDSPIVRAYNAGSPGVSPRKAQNPHWGAPAAIVQAGFIGQPRRRRPCR